jgi:hypothetical protein
MKKPFFFMIGAAAFSAMCMLATTSYAQQKTARACAVEWRANRTTLQASGKTRKEFLTECRTGAGQAAAAAAPQAAPAPQSTENAPPAPQANTAANTPSATEKIPTRRRFGRNAPLAADQFASESDAKSHCPGDTVVWANTRSKKYHFADSPIYGKTKRGAYMCEKDTAALGIRLAKNEKRR